MRGMTAVGRRRGRRSRAGRQACVAEPSHAGGHAAACAVAAADAQLAKTVPARGERGAALREQQRVARAARDLTATQPLVGPSEAWSLQP